MPSGNAILRVYEERTRRLRETEAQTKLFLGTVKPHNPVALSTVARWLRSMMEKAGIDISVFKAHSKRGTAVTAAANAGITTEDILKAADWSSDTNSTINRQKIPSLGRLCYPNRNLIELQTTIVDI